MQYSIQIDVKEIDARSSQFSCELVVRNIGDAPFEVVAATPRLPKGLRLNEAVDSSQIELSYRYDKLCRRVENMIGTYLVTASSDLTEAHVKQMKDAVRKLLTWRSIVEMYLSIILMQSAKYLRQARENFTRLPITSLVEAERALNILKAHQPSPVEVQTVEYTIQILRDIENEDEFRASRASRAIVQKDQEHKAVYIIDAKRGWFDTWSYSVSFDVGLRTTDGTLQISRTESAPLSVTPSALSLTAVAVVTALIGSVIRFLSAAAEPPTWDQIAVGWAGFLVSALTAAIVFNIFDFTSLRDQFRARISWRAAIFVGFACGYLNDRILKALQALLG